MEFFLKTAFNVFPEYCLKRFWSISNCSMGKTVAYNISSPSNWSWIYYIWQALALWMRPYALHIYLNSNSPQDTWNSISLKMFQKFRLLVRLQKVLIPFSETIITRPKIEYFCHILTGALPNPCVPSSADFKKRLCDFQPYDLFFPTDESSQAYRYFIATSMASIQKSTIF